MGGAAGRTGIRPADDFFDLGGHSLLAAQLMLRIKETFNRSLPLTVLFGEATITRLAELLLQPDHASQEYFEDSAIAVAVLKKGGTNVPLFCVPPSSGSALRYVPLARLLDKDQPVYAIHLGGDEQDYAGLLFEQIAKRCVDHVRRLRPRGPYLLCGHSLGGVLAYEMARQLIAAGERVDLLAIFDGRPPGSRQLLPLHRRVPLHFRRLAALEPREAVHYVFRRLRSSLHRAKDPPPTAARHDAFQAYRPPPYPGVITLFRAKIEPEWIELTILPQPLNGWDALCGRIQVHSIPGDHISMFREPNLSVLAHVLTDCLRRAAGTD